MYNTLKNDRTLKVYLVLHYDQCMYIYTLVPIQLWFKTTTRSILYLIWLQILYKDTSVYFCHLHQEKTAHFQIWFIPLCLHILSQTPSVLYQFFTKIREYYVAICTHHYYTIHSFRLLSTSSHNNNYYTYAFFSLKQNYKPTTIHKLTKENTHSPYHEESIWEINRKITGVYHDWWGKGYRIPHHPQVAPPDHIGCLRFSEER